jgi:VIT1/CCC1 family predicted Fe2+/Mn2+ transporter
MKLKIADSLMAGFGFGTSSGVITTLGMIVGLYSASSERLAIIGGIFTVSVADALSDALGEHISEESKKHTTPKDIRNITISTFVSKLVIGLSFAIPFILLSVNHAVVASVAYSALVLVLLSLRIAKKTGQNRYEVITEHLLVGFAVVIITFFLGKWVETAFSNNSL